MGWGMSTLPKSPLDNVILFTTQEAPSAVENEEGVLGGLFLNPLRLSEVLSIVQPDDFFILRNNWVLEAMQALGERKEEIDYLTVAQELRERGRLDDIGGLAYLTYLIGNTPTSENTVDYARAVKRAAIRRHLLEAAEQLNLIARDPNKTIHQVIQDSENTLAEVTVSYRRAHENGLRPVSDYIQANIDHMQAAYEAYTKGVPLGFRTGYNALDNLFTIQNGMLITVAARPRVGKSAFMQSVIYNQILARFINSDADGEKVRLNNGMVLTIPGQSEVQKLPRIALFSAEMSYDQNINRFAAMLTGISAHKQETGRMTFSEFQDVTVAKRAIGAVRSRFLIVARGLTPAFVKSECRSWQPDMIFVDYLQKMQAGIDRYKTRREEVGYVCGQLKDLSLELNRPIIQGAQINRTGSEKPTLENIKESGSIEEDSDAVLILHREELYNENTERPNEADIEVAKHRNGDTGRVELFYHKNKTLFANLVKTTIQPEW